MARQAIKGSAKTDANNPVVPVETTSRDSLTDKQKAFCRLYVEHGGKAIDALRGAGYKIPNEGLAELAFDQLIASPAVQNEIRRKQQSLLKGKLASMSLGVIHDLLADTELNPRVRLEAAKTVLDKANITEDGEKGAGEMAALSIDSLRQLLEETRQTLGDLDEIVTDPRIDPAVIDG